VATARLSLVLLQVALARLVVGGLTGVHVAGSHHEGSGATLELVGSLCVVALPPVALVVVERSPVVCSALAELSAVRSPRSWDLLRRLIRVGGALVSS